MEKKRKVSQEELATTCLCAPAIALYREELLQYTVALLLPRWHWIEQTQQLEITAIVSFSVLFLSVYCLLVLTASTFGFSKDLDTVYTRHNTSS